MKKIKLQARDQQDIQNLSALLQDSIVPACDISFHEEDQTFIMAVQRFVWGEEAIGADLPYKRVCSAVTFSGVSNVQFKGMNPRDPTALFDLLTMTFEKDAIHLVFAGEGEVKLLGKDWVVLVEDFGDSWPVKNKPSHDN